MCIHGLMGGNMKVSIRMIRSMVMGYMNGLTEDIIKDGGIRENNMD